MSAPIRVVLVEDSRVISELLTAILQSDPRFEIVASYAMAEEAIARLESDKPNVISMDIRLPGMNGLEATQTILRQYPVAIVICSATATEDRFLSMNALRAGALSVVEKPVGPAQRNFAELKDKYLTQLAIMSGVHVIKQRAVHRRTDASLDVNGLVPPAAVTKPAPSPLPQKGKWSCLGIVASTGGPFALAALLKQLPASYPLPILLVQHMVPSFVDGFVSWLSTISPIPAKFAEPGETPVAGNIYLPPAEHHLVLTKAGLGLNQDAPVSYQRPSGTILFQSMAATLGPQALGVLLTGMGEDGAEGLSAVHKAGGHTIAEDETTAVVYGMPKAAVQLGAVKDLLPLHAIPARLIQLVLASEGNRVTKSKAVA